MIDVEIELLYVPDCPNRAAARALIEQALARAQRSAVVHELEIRSAEEAERRGLRGSPTILVDGWDPFADSADPPSMSCRLYRSDAGVRGVPTLSQLIEALGRVGRDPLTIDPEEPIARAIVAAIHSGDVAALRTILNQHPGLAAARLGTGPEGSGPDVTRSLLHVVTDWPGHYPNGAAMVAVLVAAGADVNTRFTGPHTETPLHWAASSNDVEVLDALLDAGADIDAPGAVIAGGTPLSDAVAFGQWDAARRLVERGAHVSFREAAALGLADRVERSLAGDPPLTRDDITHAFWYACHGGQRAVAEHLLSRGADINWVSTWDNLTPLDAARRSEATAVVTWLLDRGGRSASGRTR